MLLQDFTIDRYVCTSRDSKLVTVNIPRNAHTQLDAVHQL